MRIEELENNNLIKSTDTVEKYLLGLIKEYFKYTSHADLDTQESIIQRAVTRMKEELTIDNAGVVSINGQTGAVTIDCNSLGAEPLIVNKKTAFNVNFGTEPNTACMGNDPRLSDKRIPKPHTHDLSEINGLMGELNSVLNEVQILGNTTHNHLNQNVLSKISYSGNKGIINLDDLMEIKEKIENKIQEIDSQITTYQTQLDAMINDIQSKINSL